MISIYIHLLNKKTQFLWKSEHEETFQKIEKTIMNLPTMKALIKRRLFRVYLAATSSVIRALLT